MNKMEYFEPKTIEEASSLLKDLGGEVTVIAGGTDVVVRYNKDALGYTKLVNIKNICGIKGIAKTDKGIEIGALTTHTEIADNELVKEYLPALAYACNQVGSRLIRNMGTIGGNICNASPVADSVCPLLVLNAVFTVAGADGAREIKADDFFTGPGRTTKAKEEILTKVFIPFTTKHQGFAKLGPRKNADIALVNTAVAFTVDNGIITDAKIAFGSVGPKAFRITDAEKLMIGKKPAELNLDQVAKACEDAVTPITDVRSTKEYRRRTSYYLIRDTLLQLINNI